MRLRFYVATLVTAVIMGLGTPPTALAVDRTDECRYAFADGNASFSDWEVKQTIRCVTNKYHVNTRKALLIASHESGFNENARNSESGACGIFQHIPRYWGGRIDAAEQAWPNQRTFGDGCFNARSNIYAAVKLAKSSGGWDYHWCRFADYC